MKVPTYQTQSQRTTESNTSPLTAKANPSILSSPQIAMKNFADTAYKISSDFYKKELKIRDDNQLTSAVNAFAEGLDNASIEANKEQDPSKIRPKFDELTANLISDTASTITSKDTRSIFVNKGTSLLTNYNININNQVRKKEIQKTFGEKVKREKFLINNAVNGNSAERVAALDELFGNDSMGLPGLYEGMSGNLMDPGDAFNRSETVKKQIAKERIIVEFNSLDNVEKKQAFVENLKANPPKDLMPLTVDDISRKLTNIIDTNINKARTLKNITSKEEVSKFLDGLPDMSEEELIEQLAVLKEFSPEDLLMTVGDYNKTKQTIQSRIRFLQNDAELKRNKKQLKNLGNIQLELFEAGDDEEKIKAVLDKVKEIDPTLDFLKPGQIAAIGNVIQAKIELLEKEDSIDLLNNEKIKIKKMAIAGDLVGLNEELLKLLGDEDAAKTDAANYLGTLNALSSEISKLESKSNAAVSELSKRLKSFMSIIEGGGQINEDQFTALEEKAANLGDYGMALIPNINQAKDLNAILGNMRSMRPDMVQAATSSFAQGYSVTREGPDRRTETIEFGGPGVNTEFEKVLVKASKTLQSNILNGLNNDPIGWAATAGVLDQPGLLMFDPNDMGTTAGSIVLRRNQALEVAAHYGMAQPTFLRPGEKQLLVNTLYNSPKQTRLNFLTALVQGFGADAPDVLGELASEGPEFAHIGGLMLLGNMSAVNLALDGLDLKKDGITATDFTSINKNEIFDEVVGSALGANMSMAGDLASGRNIADAIYLAIATKRGFNVFEDGIYEDAIQMAFGANLDNGTGGIQEVRGERTLVPPGFTGDMVETALNSITQDYLRSVGYNVDDGLFKEIKGSFKAMFGFSSPYKVVSVGNGLYQFQQSLSHQTTIAVDNDGNIIQILIADLIAAQQ